MKECRDLLMERMIVLQVCTLKVRNVYLALEQ